jgi:hypothetical protein
MSPTKRPITMSENGNEPNGRRKGTGLRSRLLLQPHPRDAVITIDNLRSSNQKEEDQSQTSLAKCNT